MSSFGGNEEEMKLREEKRIKQNKISVLMGQYMLCGYRMLNEICEICKTILLQDKSGNFYCVSCKDLGGDDDSKTESVKQIVKDEKDDHEKISADQHVSLDQKDVNKKTPEDQNVFVYRGTLESCVEYVNKVLYNAEVYYKDPSERFKLIHSGCDVLRDLKSISSEIFIKK